MEIKEIEIEKITPYRKNAKKHDKTQIDNVAESIKQFGMVQPLVLDNNNEIIIGHCRFEACKKLGYKTVPCVLASDLDRVQVEKLRLLDNRLNESEWNIDLLSELVPELDFYGFDVDWEISELDKNIERKDISDKITEKCELIIKCKDEEELEILYNEMIERGYECKISTL